METNNRALVFHEGVVSSDSRLAKYIRPFSKIIEKDTPGSTFGFNDKMLNALALDIDDMETDLAFGEKQETMDIAFGVADYDSTSGKLSNHRILLTELKLDCKSFRSISHDCRNLLAKESHSRELLIESVIDPNNIILFKDEVAPLAIRGFRQWILEGKSKALSKWRPMGPTDFSHYIGFTKDFPYKPITNLEGLEFHFLNLIRNDAEEIIIDELYRLRGLAERYLQRYMLLEVTHIAENVILAIRTILEDITEEKEMIEYLLSDFENLKNSSR